jgi:kumamolisin
MNHGAVSRLFLFALLSLLVGTFPSKAGAKVPPADPSVDNAITITLALASRDEAGAYRVAAAYSDPSSSSFHSPLSAKEWVRRYGPDPGAVQRLVSELSRRGLQPKPWNGGTLLQVEGTATSLMATFDLKSRGSSPSLRAQFGGLIRAVLGLPEPTGASAVWRGAATLVPRNSPSYSIGQVTAAYDFSPLYAAGLHGEHMRVALVELAPYDRTDVATFAARLGHGLSLHDHQVDAGNTKAPANVEATVDIELLSGTVPAADIDVWNVPPDSDGQGLIDAYGDVAGDPTVNVLGLTWVTCETDAARIPGFLAAEHLLFAQITAQGTTIVGATGDSGAYACADPAQAPSAPANSRPEVSVPAADPYVLGVGATDLSLKITGSATHIAGEAAWSCLAVQYPDCAATSALGAGTGGGVSRIYSKKSDNLSWQTGLGVKNKQSTGNRQVPDVAASGSSGLGNGHGYAIFYHNAWTVGGGTSAAMPIWSGLIALADQYVTQHGGAPLAWVNPLVYHLADTAQAHPAYHDIVKGGNLLYGAGPGWDYASGWGSPDAWNFVRDAAAYAASR